MPHLMLEHTDNLVPAAPLEGVLARMHSVLGEVGGIRIGNCKSRSRVVRGYLVGDGARPAAFVHLEVRLLEGRSLETRRAIGERLLEILRDAFRAPHDVEDLQITVEIRDLEKELYFKIPEGTLGNP